MVLKELECTHIEIKNAYHEIQDTKKICKQLYASNAWDDKIKAPFIRERIKIWSFLPQNMSQSESPECTFPKSKIQTAKA